MDNCPICLNQMTLETSVSTICNHQYCEACLNTWLENHHTCPLCRAEIEDDDEDDNRPLPAEYVAIVRNIVVDIWVEIWQDMINEQSPNAGNFFDEMMPLLEEDALQQYYREEEARAERINRERDLIRERINYDIERAHIEQEARIMRRQQEAEDEHIRRNQ